MGQAKLRKAEIMALKAKPKFKAHQEGFKPDAGLNSQEGLNHYWFQVAEMLQTLMVQPKMRAYEINGVSTIELNATVNIMNYEGTEHTAPQTREGYFATLRFTADNLDQLADQIDKGAMSVRVSGIPADADTSPTGEKFRIINAVESWSAGNGSKHMNYYINMSSFNSRDVAARFRAIAEQMRSE